MASDFYYPTSKNAVQKTLSAQLLSTASTGDAITFDDVDGVQNKPGVLVINRVDSNGTATPSSREYISYSGTSGTTVLIETRNVDGGGAARTHAVGSVVEFIPDAVWAQRIIDQFLIEHNAPGTHKAITATSIRATSATLTGLNSTAMSFATGATLTGMLDEDDFASNSDTKTATQQSIKAYVAANAGGSVATDAIWAAKGDLVKGTANDAADVLSIGSAEDILRVVSGTAAWVGANYKAGAGTRDMTATSADVGYTGVGFTPKVLVIIAVKDTTLLHSIGLASGTGGYCIYQLSGTAFSYSGTKLIEISDGSAAQEAGVKSFDADGFTLSWNKVGSPTGTANFYYLAFR